MYRDFKLWLRAIEIENFRLFKERQRFELGQITLLIGPNGSGKSTLLKFIEFISRNASVTSTFPYELNAGFQDINLSTFRNILSDFKVNQLNYSLEFDISPNSKSRRQLVSLFLAASKIDFSYKLARDKSKSILTALKFSHEGDKWLEITGSPQLFKVEIAPDLFRVYRNEIEKNKEQALRAFADYFPTGKMVTGWTSSLLDLDTIEIHTNKSTRETYEMVYQIFDMVWNYYKEDDRKEFNFENLVNKIITELDEVQEGVIFTLRNWEAKPESVFFRSKVKNFFVRYFWSHFASFLSSLKIHFQTDYERVDAERTKLTRFFEVGGSDYLSRLLFRKDNSFLADSGGKWLKKFTIGEELKIATLNDGMHKRIIIKKGGRDFDLCDLGYGYYQLMPMLLNLDDLNFESQHYPKSWLISEPEANLHPKLQSLLADLYAVQSKENYSEFIIETHSEYLIRRLQYLLANHYISSEEKRPDLPDMENVDVSIYYFNDPENIPDGRKQIYKIEIDKQGRLTDNFGEGFFDVSGNLEFMLYTSTN